jgi:hypothetical protein
MDEVIKMVSDKIGVSEDQARTAVTTVVGFLKDKLPEPIASQLDGIMSGNVSMDSLGDLAKGIGGMFGGDDK